MSVFYDEMAEVADELLSEFGQTATVGVPGAQTLNTTTGIKTPTYTNHTVTAAVFDYPQKLIDGSLIKVGDKRVLVSAVGITFSPAPLQKFTDVNGLEYKVINARAVAPAGQSVLWILQVQR